MIEDGTLEDYGKMPTMEDVKKAFGIIKKRSDKNGNASN